MVSPYHFDTFKIAFVWTNLCLVLIFSIFNCHGAGPSNAMGLRMQLPFLSWSYPAKAEGTGNTIGTCMDRYSRELLGDELKAMCAMILESSQYFFQKKHWKKGVGKHETMPQVEISSYIIGSYLFYFTDGYWRSHTLSGYNSVVLDCLSQSERRKSESCALFGGLRRLPKCRGVLLLPLPEFPKILGNLSLLLIHHLNLDFGLTFFHWHLLNKERKIANRTNNQKQYANNNLLTTHPLKPEHFKSQHPSPARKTRIKNTNSH